MTYLKLLKKHEAQFGPLGINKPDWFIRQGGVCTFVPFVGNLEVGEATTSDGFVNVYMIELADRFFTVILLSVFTKLTGFTGHHVIPNAHTVAWFEFGDILSHLFHHPNYFMPATKSSHSI